MGAIQATMSAMAVTADSYAGTRPSSPPSNHSLSPFGAEEPRWTNLIARLLPELGDGFFPEPSRDRTVNVITTGQLASTGFDHVRFTTPIRGRHGAPHW
jgi:hypothetical protein